MYAMTNPVRRHAWGTTEDIPRLLGIEPDGGPYAELWLSGYEDESSTLHGRGREERLCDVVRVDGGARLPFLAKVLAIGSPLSLQLHPRGPGAKPEMLYALSSCTTLCGFRTAAETHALLRRLDVAALDPVTAAVATGAQTSLRAAMAAMLRTPRADEVNAQVLSALRRVDDLDPRLLATVRVLVSQCPDDSAALAPLLMTVVDLRPGEAMFCAPGQPHTNLSGLGFEVQANSDEVVRGGLTAKPVDVDAFVDGLDTRVGAARVLPRRDGPEEVFEPGVGLFALGVVSRAGGPLPAVPGPQILLCVAGGFEVEDGGGAERLGMGDAVFVPGPSPSVSAVGSGLLLRVTRGRAG